MKHDFQPPMGPDDRWSWPGAVVIAVLVLVLVGMFSL